MDSLAMEDVFPIVFLFACVCCSLMYLNICPTFLLLSLCSEIPLSGDIPECMRFKMRGQLGAQQKHWQTSWIHHWLLLVNGKVVLEAEVYWNLRSETFWFFL